MIVSNFTDKTDITYLTDDITDRAVEFLQEAGKDKKPFFMFVSYNAPHWPNEAKPEDIAKFRNVQDGERRVYCAMVYAMDRGIGRILDALKADGLEKDTIVVFLSDNGGAPEASSCNAPFRGAKRQHFEGGVRVPFIIRYPADKRLVPGSVCRQPVSSRGFASRFAEGEWPSHSQEAGRHGYSGAGGEQGSSVPRTFFWCTDYTSAVLAGDMKYLLVPDRAPQFYNVADDPQEQRDLYFSRHQDADPLAKKLGTYLTTTPACRFPDSISWSAKLMREYDKTAPDRQPE